MDSINTSGDHPAPNLESGMSTNSLMVFPTANSYESLVQFFCNDDKKSEQCGLHFLKIKKSCQL